MKDEYPKESRLPDRAKEEVFTLEWKLSEEDFKASVKHLKETIRGKKITIDAFKALYYPARKWKYWPHVVVFLAPGLIKVKTIEELSQWWKSMYKSSDQRVRDLFLIHKNILKEQIQYRKTIEHEEQQKTSK